MKSKTAMDTASADAPANASSEKLPERIAAAEAIKGGVRQWSNGIYTDGVQLPIIRIGLILCYFGSKASDPIAQVLEGSILPSKRTKAEERERWAAYACSLRQCVRPDSLLKEAERRDLAKGGRRGRTDEERMCVAMGVGKLLFASITLELEAVERCIAQLDKEVEEQPRKRGRERNHAAYAVAAALAQLYAKITGKRPTYSEGKDGLSGEFTPVLRNVFDALGWETTALRGPAEAAVSGITRADLYPKEMAQLRGLPQSLLVCRTEN